jgi:hypothetical protein
VKATDSNGASAVSPSLAITIAAANANDALLTGNYAFEFSGFDSSGTVVAAGSFRADGKGNITNGVEDLNSIQGLPKNQTFIRTYTLGADNRGVLSFATGSPGSVFATYTFAVDSTGVHGRLIAFHSTGLRGSGELQQQSVAGCAFNTIDGHYVIGFTGRSKSFPGVFIGGPVAVAGSFIAAAPTNAGAQGSLGPGEMDANTPGFVSVSPLTVSGTYKTTSQNARCSMSISVASLPTVTFTVYPVSSTEAFVVETDAVSPTTPLVTTGKLIMQMGQPFSGLGALSGTVWRG